MHFWDEGEDGGNQQPEDSINEASVEEEMSCEEEEEKSNTSAEVESKETDSDLEDDEDMECTKFFDMDEEEEGKSRSIDLALVGGSNAPKIQLVSDESLKVSTVTLWEGGANIIQGADKVRELSPDDRESLDIVVLHLGTCDFPCQGSTSVVSHYLAYREVTTKVSQLCPNAHIIMSGILPQAGINRELANEQILCFNDALKSVGDDESEPNLHFCDNWTHFISYGP